MCDKYVPTTSLISMFPPRAHNRAGGGGGGGGGGERACNSPCGP